MWIDCVEFVIKAGQDAGHVSGHLKDWGRQVGCVLGDPGGIHWTCGANAGQAVALGKSSSQEGSAAHQGVAVTAVQRQLPERPLREFAESTEGRLEDICLFRFHFLNEYVPFALWCLRWFMKTEWENLH